MSMFNPFSVKNNSDYSDVRVRLQEIVFYADSRFRAILVHVSKDTSKTDLDRMSWTQKLLHRELVGYLLLL